MSKITGIDVDLKILRMYASYGVVAETNSERLAQFFFSILSAVFF